MSWVLLTISCEFSLGYLAFHRPPGEIASDFDLPQRRPLTIGLAPLVARVLR
jgi:hypothetical protein